ncbi:MAG TPA: hypothetical protein VLA89_11115 [Gemmatimonadales bacterium]|nr:hypothetical protein [Gemmatimonadales bacterium]
MIVRITSTTSGPRLYVIGRRVHHGAVGVGLLAAAPLLRGRARAMAAASGLALLAYRHEYRDFPFRDCDNHGCDGTHPPAASL